MLDRTRNPPETLIQVKTNLDLKALTVGPKAMRILVAISSFISLIWDCLHHMLQLNNLSLNMRLLPLNMSPFDNWSLSFFSKLCQLNVIRVGVWGIDYLTRKTDACLITFKSTCLRSHEHPPCVHCLHFKTLFIRSTRHQWALSSIHALRLLCTYTRHSHQAVFDFQRLLL